MSPVRCLRSTTKKVSPWTPTRTKLQKNSKLFAGKSPVKVLMSCTSKNSKARQTVLSSTAANILTRSKLSDQQSEQLLRMECDVEPDSDSSDTRVPVVSNRKKTKPVYTTMNKKNACGVVDFTRSSPMQNQAVCSDMQNAKKNEPCKVNKLSENLTSTANTSVKPSCSKWSDDKLPISDMEPQSNEDSSKTGFRKTGEELNTNKVGLTFRKTNKRDVPTSLFDGSTKKKFKSLDEDTDKSKKYQNVHRKKGPPCKGFEYLEKRKQARKVDKLAANSDSDGTSDLDYEVSEKNSSDSEDEISDEIQTDEDNEGSRTLNESDNVDEEWYSVRGKHHSFVYEEHESLQDCVPTVDQEPAAFYNLLIDEEVIEFMVRETNRNAHQVIAKESATQDSRLNSWSDTDNVEMTRFLGLLCYMGIVKMPSIDSYWRTSAMFRNCVAPQTMTRNRFQLLLRMWHFSNNEDAPENERTFKIKEFMQLVLSKFIAAKIPDENIVIDESMILFRGRLKFRQYMPGKAHKFGIKLFKICDPKGYTYRIIVYPGKSEMVSRNLATDTVMELAEDYLDAGRTVCTDNFYTSLPLANQLLSRRTHLIGTLRANRKGLPKCVTTAKLKKGEVVGVENSSGTVVMKWRDKRDVYFLSTKHGVKQVNTGKKNRQKEDILKPEAILCYNQCKQGIDLSDQLSSYYNCLRKTIRWYHKVAIDLLLGTAVVNALILQNERLVAFSKKPMTMVKFRELLATSLLQYDDHRLTPSTQPSIHYLQETDERENGKRKDRRKRRYCIGCYNSLTEERGRDFAKKKAKRVITECAACPGKPRFCYRCFPKFHGK